MSGLMNRRTFLAAGATTVALAACGSGSGSASGTSASTSSQPTGSTLLGFYASDALVPGSPQRFPYGLADAQGALLDDVPASVIFSVSGPDGKAVGSPIKVDSHRQGLPRAYYPLVFTPPAAGIYSVRADIGSQAQERKVQLAAMSKVVQPGQPMVPLDTPTTANQQGVELLCTRQPACPLHDVTLSAALGEARPLAFLVATPQFCQTAICGPVLDVLLSVKDRFPQVRFLHSEVYPSVAAAQPSGPGSGVTVPAVHAYGLSFEPCLFLARPDGSIAQRLDVIFDAAEVSDALTALTR
jgi:hypothetical protein